MTLAPLDLFVVIAYFVAILAIGLWFGRGERNTHDFFLGARRQPWLIVGLSIVATEVSAITFIAVPAVSFSGDWNYLQMYAGAILGRIVVIFVLLPAFYGGSVTTVYEYLGQRFGPATRTTASLMFLASRVIGSGIRLLAACMAISIVFSWPLEWVIVGAAAVAVLYTVFGGIKAIIWTDALQALVFLAAGVAVLVFVFISIPGAWTDNVSTAYEAGKLHTFTWGLNPNNEKIFWVLLISTTVQNCAAFGVDQDLTQRMLTCVDLRRGQRAVMFNTVAGLPVVCLFLLLGTMLSVYYASGVGSPLPDEVLERSDHIFPHFIATALPNGYGLRGLLCAGIFAAAMSSLDSALGALASTAVTDFYRPYVRREAPEAHYLRVARFCTFAFGVLLAGVALAFVGYDQLLWQVFKWAGLFFGGMLGVFLLGVTTRGRGRDAVNVVAMISSVVILGAIKTYQEQTGDVIIAWPWWVVIGTGWTYLFGVCFASAGERTSERYRSPL